MADETMTLLSRVKFWILLLLLIPSAICSILILLYFYKKWRTISLDHHFILILTIISLLQIVSDAPFAMIYNRYDRVTLASDIFCKWWNWWDYSLNVLSVFEMAWGSAERHLLIFHRAFVNTTRKRIVFHILPILTLLLYPTIFYFILIFWNSCQNQWDYGDLLCGIPCYSINQPILATFDFLFNIVFSTCIITIGNLYLIIRVLIQKRHQQDLWRRHRKLTRQLLCIALVYIVCWVPLAINGFLLLFQSSSISQELQTNYFPFLLYMVPISLPFIFVSFLSDFIKTILRRSQRQINPIFFQT